MKYIHRILFPDKMYVVVVYDVEGGRTHLFHDECQQYLTWIQNSVFEGKLSPGKRFKLEDRLKVMLNEGESVVIYTWKTSAYDRKVLGDAPNPEEILL